MSNLFEIVFILVLVLLNGIFAMAEFAIISAKKPSSSGPMKEINVQRLHLNLPMSPLKTDASSLDT